MPRPETALLIPPSFCSSAVLSRLGGKEDLFPLGKLPCPQPLGRAPMSIPEAPILGEKSVPAAELVWARGHGQEPGTGGDSPRPWLQPQADAGRGGVAHGSRCQPLAWTWACVWLSPKCLDLGVQGEQGLPEPRAPMRVTVTIATSCRAP